MIDAQLAPPPVAASRGRGTTPAGGEDAAGQVESTHPEESFSAALGRRSTHRASDDSGGGTQNTNDAAGPRTGELQGEDAADAGASQGETPPADDVAVAIAGAIVAAVPQAVVAQAAAAPAVAVVAAAAAPATAAPATAAPATGPVPAPVPPVPEAVPVPAKPGPTGPAMPVAAPVPPVAEAVPAPAPGTANQIMAAATPPVANATEGATDGATAAPAATPSATSGTTAAAPAATVSLTLTPVADDPAAGTPQAVAPAAAATPQHAAKDAPAPAAAATEQAPAPARTDLPTGVAIAPPPAQQTRLDALSGTVTHGGGATTPHELAKELGQRVHMAIREGGKELLVNLRPPDLGHLTIRVTMTEGVLQAQITADRPEAAKLLQQALGNLDSALGDLGYAMGNLDVAYQGGRDAQASSQGSQGSAARGGTADAGDSADAAAPAVTATGTGDSSGLDLLA
ncbi:MAG: flagellar hook-length control protein FliK [Thermoleophilia bacterium]